MTTLTDTALDSIVDSIFSPAPVKRKYTVTDSRPKNKPNSSDLVLRQVSNANRITGTMTAVYDSSNITEDDDLDDFVISATDGSDDRWLVACHDHEFSTTFTTLLIARRIAFIPNLWCAECAEDVPVETDLTIEEMAGARVYALQH